MTAAHLVPPQDPQAATRQQWDAAAAGWDRHTPAIRQWLQAPTAALLAAAGVRPGARVLDVAAGAGDQTLDLAERVGPGGEVVALDLSPALVALGQARVRQAGCAQVQWQVGDGEALPAESGGFDAAVCRLGLMLFAQPLRGLQEMHRALRPGGRVSLLVFSTPARNPCVSLLMATARRHAGLPPPDPQAPAAGQLFSLGQPGQLDALCREAGFVEVSTTAMSLPFPMPSAAHYLAFIRSSASPILQLLAGLGEAAAQAAWDDMAAQLQAFNTPTGWLGPNELLLTAARKP